MRLNAGGTDPKSDFYREKTRRLKDCCAENSFCYQILQIILGICNRLVQSSKDVLILYSV